MYEESEEYAVAIEIVPVPNKFQVEDLIPNYRYELRGIEVNEAEAERQKQYLLMFLKENFEVVEQQLSANTDLAQLNAYLKGSKDMLAFVLLWIDSLNTKADVGGDITE